MTSQGGFLKHYKLSRSGYTNLEIQILHKFLYFSQGNDKKLHVTLSNKKNDIELSKIERKKFSSFVFKLTKVQGCY